MSSQFGRGREVGACPLKVTFTNSTVQKLPTGVSFSTTHKWKTGGHYKTEMFLVHFTDNPVAVSAFQALDCNTLHHLGMCIQPIIQMETTMIAYGSCFRTKTKITKTKKQKAQNQKNSLIISVHELEGFIKNKKST